MTRAWTAALGLAVAMLAGALAGGAATASTPFFGRDVEVTVWRALDDGDLYVGAREAGGLWRRHPAALDLSIASASGRFHRSKVVALTVPVTGFGEAVVEAVVWRSVADPSRLHLSVRRAGEGERWRTVNEPLTMRAHEPTEWQRYERADAVTVLVAFRDLPPGTRVEGPLVVFTVESGEAWTDEDGFGRARDVYVLDTATDRYWRAFAYRSASPGGVLTAGRAPHRLGENERCAASGWRGGPKRCCLKARTSIRSRYRPTARRWRSWLGDGALTVLDAATGEALLRFESRTELAALLPDAPERGFSLEGWSAASDRLAVAVNAPMGESRTGIFTLDGALRLLPPNAGDLSPDFRHAIRPHGAGCRWAWITWPGFDVIETESGRTVRTVTAPEGRFIALRDDTYQPGWQWLGWWAAPDRYAWYETPQRLLRGDGTRIGRGRGGRVHDIYLRPRHPRRRDPALGGGRGRCARGGIPRHPRYRNGGDGAARPGCVVPLANGRGAAAHARVWLLGTVLQSRLRGTPRMERPGRGGRRHRTRRTADAVRRRAARLATANPRPSGPASAFGVGGAAPGLVRGRRVRDRGGRGRWQ